VRVWRSAGKRFKRQSFAARIQGYEYKWLEASGNYISTSSQSRGFPRSTWVIHTIKYKLITYHQRQNDF
jgi:hypothetical protein